MSLQLTGGADSRPPPPAPLMPFQQPLRKHVVSVGIIFDAERSYCTLYGDEPTTSNRNLLVVRLIFVLYIDVELQIERYRVSAAEFDGQLNPKNVMEYLVG